MTTTSPPAAPKNNLPIIIITDGTNIHICKGCDKNYNSRAEALPHNMVFQHKAVTGYYNKVIKKYIHKFNSVHFHLTKKCL